jgi:hypothetical protein
MSRQTLGGKNRSHIIFITQYLVPNFFFVKILKKEKFAGGANE